MANKKIGLFDIDNVLFNDGKFIENKRIELARIFNISIDEVKKADMKAADETKVELGVFSIAVYAQKLSAALGMPQKTAEIDKLFESDLIYKDCLYSDVIACLDKLSKRYTLGIFSQGDARLQRNKLEKTSIV